MNVARVGLLVALAASALCAGAWHSALAQQTQPATFYSSEQAPARDRGIVRGTIAQVDYGRGQIAITSGHRRFEITVLPSTSIFRDGQELGLSDLTVGMRVEVSLSEIGNRMVAQIIRIK